MIDTPGRLLRLLSLLQSPREWPGRELAQRLDVSPRTIRRDIDRLRELGYPVHATQGNTGGYRLTAGTAMPPLLLDDEEAVAIAIGLRTAAAGSVTGIEETSVRALAKLEQVLPSRLRRRVTVLQEAAVALPQGGPTADAGHLALIAAACVAHEKLRFTYRSANGQEARRLVEPHQLVAAGRRWYLVAHDCDRADWRTFRLDRLADPLRTGARVPPRDLPGGVDVARLPQRRRRPPRPAPRPRPRGTGCRPHPAHSRRRRTGQRSHLPSAHRGGLTGVPRLPHLRPRLRLRHPRPSRTRAPFADVG
ncbi:hypothetical protein T261_8340 [Streptomyces lydicus]|nr:hypothetical protein T261_8340 [Streptomyces lydicus]